MKFLNPRVHGYVDYVAVALLALAPTLFAFSGVAAAICYLAAIGMLGLSLCTAYPLGMARLVPFTIHGAIEFVGSIAFVVAPWLFGFDVTASARNFFVLFGIAMFGLYMITNYKAADAYRAEPRMPHSGEGLST